MDETTACLVIPAVVIVAILGLIWYQRSAREKQIAAARAKYQRALAQLKKDPSNADLRERTLAIGRSYANLARQQKGVTIFDEMMLMNDIGAATAGATATPVPTPTRETVPQRLRHLGELREQGLITDEEYETRRQKILGDL